MADFLTETEKLIIPDFLALVVVVVVVDFDEKHRAGLLAFHNMPQWHFHVVSQPTPSPEQPAPSPSLLSPLLLWPR